MLESECYQSVQQMFILVRATSSVKLYFGSLMFKKGCVGGRSGDVAFCVCVLIKEDTARGLQRWVCETHSWREGQK